MRNYGKRTSCSSSSDDDGLTRHQAIGRAGQGLVGLAALAQLSGGGARTAAGAPTPEPATPASSPAAIPRPAEKLRLATCQFPVSGKIVENAKYIRDFLHQAAKAGAHLLHTSEASLSGYPGVDLPSFQDFDWNRCAGKRPRCGRRPKSWACGWCSARPISWTSRPSRPIACT